jgi:hypothetical protein
MKIRPVLFFDGSSKEGQSKKRPIAYLIERKPLNGLPDHVRRRADVARGRLPPLAFIRP